MSIKILIDMNLSPDWVPVLQNAGWSAGVYTIDFPRYRTTNSICSLHISCTSTGTDPFSACCSFDW